MPTSACMQGPPLNTRRGRRPRRHKKRSTRWAGSIYIPALAGGLYIYLTPSGVRYYLSLAVRPEIIKRKKRKAQWAFLFFEFN